MKKNMGIIDVVVRLLIAALFAILFFTGQVAGTLGIVLLVLGGVFVLTGLLQVCPLYMPFNISTRKKE